MFSTAGTVGDAQAQAASAGGPGIQVINTEVEIITSEDLAMEVARVVGIEKILPDAGPDAKLEDAAGTIIANLEVYAAQGNNVLHIDYSNPNADNAVLVLGELVRQYSIRHLDIHSSGANYDDVLRQTEEVRLRLKQTESELDQLRTESGISTLAGATAAIESQKARTKEDLMAAKAELADRKARLEALEQSASGDVELEKGATSKPVVVAKVPAQVISDYKATIDVLEVLQKRNMELRLKFKSGNQLLALSERQVADANSRRIALEKKYPNLVAEKEALESDRKSPGDDLRMERANLASVTARVAVFTSHLKELDEQYKEQYEIGSKIEVLERRRQMDDAEYRSLEINLKNAIMTTKLDPTRMPNLKTLQEPSKPIKTYDKITQKIVIGLAGAGMGLGLGLAFMIELLFNRRVTRPIEIQAKLQLPLLLSIPYIKRKERGGLMLSHESNVKRIGSSGSGSHALTERIDRQRSPLENQTISSFPTPKPSGTGSSSTLR